MTLLTLLIPNLLHALDICDEQYDGAVLLHPGDCGKFVICENQKTSEIFDCPPDMHFNKYTKQCDYRENANCEMLQPLPRDNVDQPICCCCDCDQTEITTNTPEDEFVELTTCSPDEENIDIL